MYAVLCLLASAAVVGAHPKVQLPEPPRLQVELGEEQQSGRTWRVPAGASLQAAVDRAALGDTIVLQAGAVYEGPLVLAAKRGVGWLTIRSSASSKLPPRGTRVTGQHGQLLATIQASGASVIKTAMGAHHYRFVGVEIRPQPGTFLYNLVELGDDRFPDRLVPHHIHFERCYLHGDPQRGGRRGIAMNSAHTAVIDSTLEDFKEVGADSQGIAGWSGPGPFLIENNAIAAAGENIMFGGADPPRRSRSPADIVIRHNHVFKPLSWKKGESVYRGTPWTVKNLFELKNAQRVLIEGNLFENNWRHAQKGFAVLFTVRNQEGRAPWSTITDVAFVDNVVRNSAHGVNILARDDTHAGKSGHAERILLRNNLFLELGGPRWGGDGVLLQVLQGPRHVVVERNTALQSGHIIMAEGPPARNFVFRYNVVPHNRGGIGGTGTASGNDTLSRYFPDALVEQNIIIGADASRYPKRNEYPQRTPESFGRSKPTERIDFEAFVTNNQGRPPGADASVLTRAESAAEGRAHRTRER